MWNDIECAFLKNVNRSRFNCLGTISFYFRNAFCIKWLQACEQLIQIAWMLSLCLKTPNQPISCCGGVCVRDVACGFREQASNCQEHVARRWWTKTHTGLWTGLNRIQFGCDPIQCARFSRFLFFMECSLQS